MVKTRAKKADSRSREDFSSCGHGSRSTRRCIFKRSARRSLSTPALSGIFNRFSVEIYLIFPPKLPTENLNLTPQRWHVSELSGSVASFGVREFEEFFRPACNRLNLVTESYRFREQWSLEELELKCLEIHNCRATRPDLTAFFCRVGD